jgi:antirestriction protein ArdC
MPTCQRCIAEVAEVTDNEHQLRSSTQQIKTLKKYFEAAHRLLFCTSRNVSQRYTKGERKMSNQVYGYITDKIMEELEHGCVPWHKPWKSPDGVRVPMNYASKKPYRGVNTFLLAVSRFKAGYDSNYWLTFKQIQALGGNVKGQHSEMVVFWRLLEKPAENPTAENETDYIPMLRYYRVFNLDQVTGIKKPVAADNLPTFQPIDEAEEVATKYQEQIEVIHGGSRAYYQPSNDWIRMPEKETFDGPEEYYSTLFHEFTHSTGHKTRLNRPGITETHYFGDEIYSKEELIAEMGAAMLSGVVGIENKTIKNSASYIQCWLDQLKTDKKLVVHAAAAAQKAADFILGKAARSDEAD